MFRGPAPLTWLGYPRTRLRENGFQLIKVLPALVLNPFSLAAATFLTGP